MSFTSIRLFTGFVCAASISALPAQAAYRLADVTVVAGNDAPPRTAIAAAEVRGYIYRLTGSWPAMAEQAPADHPAIILRTGAGSQVPADGPDPAQNFALYAEDGRQVVHGASDVSTLWAAYQLIESWGVGFYLGGDSLPPAKPDLAVEPFEGQFRPALAIRGNLPWFNFMNSPTTWNPQDYKTFFAQMVKQKANFIGFHAYDWEPFGGYDITNAAVKMGGPLMTTISPHRWCSPPAMCTKDFLFGTDLFFDRGEWGCEVGIDDAWTFAPGRSTRLQQHMMAEALQYARRIGLKTCLGYEVSGDPADPAVREAFKNRLTHTLATYPLDYFWVWQSEGRGVGGGKEGAPPDPDIAAAFSYLGKNHDLSEAARITRFVRIAHDLLKELAPDVRLVVSGWGGDAWAQFSTLYEGLDKAVPDDVIFAALDNIDPRLEPGVSKVYGKLKPGRQRWPIPWFESDGGHARMDQTGPQTNVTAFEPVLKDIAAKGCQGALGIHWRTRNVEDVAGYLYRFGWNSKLTAAEYFKAYARDHYGPDDAEYMARVHLRLEELGPQYVGASGTVECSTEFAWFHVPGSPDKWREPNRAGHLPDPARFPELEKIAADLMDRSDKAMAAGRPDAARSYRDLGLTIRWLVTRTKVGLAIWNRSSPLERNLRAAELLMDQGKMSEARQAAAGVLKDLEAYDFRSAFRGFAMTCRTRGELGMLATANSRYGRFYAAFVQRIAYVMGQPLPASRGPEVWDAAPVNTIFPVPNYIGSDQTVAFDAVLLPLAPAAGNQRRIVLTQTGESGQPTELQLFRLGGAYYRATFYPPGEGTWAWRLEGARESGASGVITVGPPAGPLQPVLDPAASAGKGQKEPVLKIDFDRPLNQIGDVVGNAKQTEGVHGQALDLREGGFLRIGDSSAPAAFSGPFTIAFFARPEKWDHAREMPVLMCKGDYAGDGWLIQLLQGQLRICLGHTRCLDADTLEPDRWTHVAVVYDGEVLRLFLDGEDAGSAEFETPPNPSSQPLRIGVYQEPGPGNPQVSPFRGCLDELVFYNRPLTQIEIAALARH